MKVIHKYFVIALLLSLLFSVGAVAAQDIQENMTFEQSNMGDVSQETISTSLDDAQEIKEVEKDTSLDQSEADETKLGDVQEIKDDSLLAQGEDNDELGAGEKTFSEIQTKINGASTGATIYLDGATYIPDTNNPITLNKQINIIIEGRTQNGKTGYATLDGMNQSSIFKIEPSSYSSSKVFSVTFKNIIFTNALSYGQGAAILQVNGVWNINIDNCKFIHNVATAGGAIRAGNAASQSSSDKYSYYYNIPSKLTITNSLFSNNEATSGSGGAINFQYGNLEITKSEFENNHASSGGAIYTYNYYSYERYRTSSDGASTSTYRETYSYYSTVINSTNFMNNDALNTGGAIYGNTYCKFYLNNCNFTGNDAQSAGALHLAWDYDMRNINFINNTATYHGGAIYSSHPGQIWTSKFINNSANGQGGAIYAKIQSIQYNTGYKSTSYTENYVNYGSQEYITRVLNSDFINNYAANEGGAVFYSSPFYVTNNKNYNSVRLELSSSKFISNSANKGGAIYDEGLKTYLSANSFINNSAHLDDSNSLYITINDLITNNIGSTIGNTYGYNGAKISQQYLSPDKRFTGNTIQGNKTEIVFDKSTFGLVNFKLLDITSSTYDKTATFSEGKIKIYATLLTANGDYKVSVNSAFNLTIGNDTYSVNFKDGYLEAKPNVKAGEYNLRIYPSDSNYYDYIKYCKIEEGKSQVTNTSDYTNQWLGYGNPYYLNVQLNIIPPAYIIEFDDTVGVPGTPLVIQVTVKDATGNPAEGNILVSYNGQEHTFNLNKNGLANVFILSPAPTTSEITVSYGEFEVTKHVIIENSVVEDPTGVYIVIPENITGHVGTSIVVPIEVYDGDNQPVSGELTITIPNNPVQYEMVTNGRANVRLPLPDAATNSFFTVLSIFDGVGVIHVNVVDTNVPIVEEDVVVIDVHSKMVGHVGNTIIIPINVTDGKKNPLEGTVTVYAGGHIYDVILTNGLADFVLKLPNTPNDNYEVLFVYGEFNEITKIKVLDNKSTEPGDDNQVIIDVDDLVVPAGRTVHIPVYVYDSYDHDLHGTIHVSYLDINKELTLADGRSTITIALPVNPTTFVLTISYEGVNKQIFVDVVSPSNPLGNMSMVETKERNKVVILLPSDAEGNVTITINGKNYTGIVKNGEVIIDVDDLPNGQYEGTVHYTGDGTYSESDKPITVVITNSDVVDPKNPLGDLSELVTNSNGQVVVNLPKDAAGEVVVTVNGKVFSATVHNGNAILDLSQLPNGNFTGTLLYTGDEAHNYSHSSKSVVVVINTQGQVNPSNPLENINQISSSDDGKLEIPFPEDATGMVKVTINGKDYYASVSGGMVILDTSDVPAGSYDATVTYTGDSKYKGSEINIPITINQGQSPDPTNPMRDVTEVTSGEDGKLEIPFPSDATGMVKVTINGKDYYGSVVNGKVVIDTSDLPSGNYNATVTYTGDTKYSGSEKTVPVTIPDDPKNPMKDVTEVKSGEDGKLEIPFPEDATGMVRVTINGKDYYGSVVNGKVVLDTSDLPAGNYTATVIYTGDTKYSGSEKTVPVTIKEEADPTNPMKDITEVKSGDDSKLEIPFPSDATGNVVVNINGKDYPATIVDGKVVLDTSQIPVGNYTAVVKYEGDSKYSSSEKNVTVIIKEPADPANPMKDITEVKSGDDGKVEIEFPTDATGMVVVNINGKDYPATIVDGKVLLDPKDVPAGNYTAVVKYSGDSKYSSSEKNVTVIIKEVVKPVDPTNPMGDITQTTSNDDGKVEIDLPKDATGTATVVIDGKEYPAKIVDGKIVFDTKDVPQGNYNATVKYSGDGKYSSSEKTVTMIIKEYHSSTTNNNNIIKQPAKKVKKASKITAKKMTFKAKKKVKKYSITLKSGKTPLKKVQVTIKVGKKTYKAKTNAKGKATFKINKLTKKGKYTAVIKYKGDKTYKATSKKVKITVK